jgi:hypothetical protein
MIADDPHIEALFDLCARHGAGDVGLTFRRGHLNLIEAVLTFEWNDERHERWAAIDHAGMSALEQLAHITRCVFEPEHKSTYAAALRERGGRAVAR